MSTLPTDHQTEWGPELNLEYPDLTSSMPFILFKLVVAGNDAHPQYIPNSQYGILVGQSLTRDSLTAQKDSDRNIKDNAAQSREQEDGIILYPNPANQRIIIQLPNTSSNYVLNILNNSSQLIESNIPLKNLTNEVNISKLSKGIYQIVVTGTDGVTHFKLVVE